MTIDSISFSSYAANVRLGDTIAAYIGTDKSPISENSVVKRKQDGNYHVVGIATNCQATPDMDQLFDRLMRTDDFRSISIKPDKGSNGILALFTLSSIGGINEEVHKKAKESIYNICLDHKDQARATT